MACALSPCEGVGHHLGFLGIKRCPGVKVLSCISQKKWLKVVVNHKNLALWRAGEGDAGRCER